MKQAVITITVHHKKKVRKRRNDPVFVGMLLAVALSVVSLFFIYTDSSEAAYITPEENGYHRVIREEIKDVEDLSYLDYMEIKTDPLQYRILAADPEEMTILAQTVYGEARGVESKAQQAAVIWCVFNRIDDPRWGDTVVEVCNPKAFNGYSPSNPVDPELYALALDVYNRWQREKLGDLDSGRVLPSEYVYFNGDGRVNWFRTEYKDSGSYWDWSLPDPYVEVN